MTRRRHKTTPKPLLAEYRQAVVDLLLKHGAEEGGILLYEYTVETPAGTLYVSPHEPLVCTGLWIHARFKDVDRAKRVLYPGQKVHIGGSQRLNPYSGKWNFTNHESFLISFERLMQRPS